ncbi:aspartyl-phosphate phosphatase Spo0E family protein [Marinisporobacter balticus]|uniref:Spo0E like sporulation regulatory protein n=1 Tax=Marinisporobacter balticus TaxID=2018667 RepID=A0A4V2SBU3_9FIRM|nr:aspartyl-phosphate phosphatase Spo0E family protein [Marinisporobacter balticus]TCO76850.1 Spo0E like sporulation regulatory protein [Marinisporobacter balticus]
MENYNNELQLIKAQIENTRRKLNELIKQSEGNLLNSEVIELSQLLDKFLSKYDHIKK